MSELIRIFQTIQSIWKCEINISHLWIFINLDILTTVLEKLSISERHFCYGPPFLVDWYWSQNLVWTLTCATYNKLSHKTFENAHQANNLANIPHFLFTNGKSTYVNYILKLIKVHIFWEGHKILRNLHLTFDYSTYSQK